MPSPSTTLTVGRPDLATFFEYEYAASESMFIGHQVLPLFPVARQSGTFGRVTLESLLEHATDTNRAPGSGYNRRQLKFTEDSYATSEHGLEEPIDDREKNMYMDYIDAHAVATARAVNSILTAHEKRVAAAVFDTSFYTGAYAQTLGNGQWSAAASTPITDVANARAKHRTNTGLTPNAIIINETIFQELRRHADIIAAVHSQGAGDQARVRDITTAQLAAIFDLDFVLVPGGMENTANPAVAATLVDIWGDHALICKIATTQDLREPCLGRTFHWQGDGSTDGGTIETYREEAIRSDIVRVRHETDEKMLYQEVGVMIQSVT